MPAAAHRRRASLAVLALALACAAPAAAQTTAAAPPSDPYEHLNRKVFAFNQSLDRHVLRPVALAWKRVVPSVIREGLRNALSNLGEPVVFMNDMVQGRADDASVTLQRFVVNSTVGMAGVADVARAWKLPHHDNGFGTTLGRFGVGPGPYLYAPVLGPGDVRDFIGSGVDTLLNPQTWINYGARTPVGISEGVSGGLNARADADPELQTLKATSTDEYAALRSLYLQNRQAQIRGTAVDVNALPDFDDPGAPATAPAAPGAVSPTGRGPLKTPGPLAPAGDASALPQAAPTTDPTTPPPGSTTSPGEEATDGAVAPPPPGPPPPPPPPPPPGATPG